MGAREVAVAYRLAETAEAAAVEDVAEAEDAEEGVEDEQNHRQDVCLKRCGDYSITWTDCTRILKKLFRPGICAGIRKKNLGDHNQARCRIVMTVDPVALDHRVDQVT